MQVCSFVMSVFCVLSFTRRGFDNSGAMAIGDYLRIGQHLRFMVGNSAGLLSAPKP
jgi:hypothetical protein